MGLEHDLESPGGREVGGRPLTAAPGPPGLVDSVVIEGGDGSGLSLGLSGNISASFEYFAGEDLFFAPSSSVGLTPWAHEPIEFLRVSGSDATCPVHVLWWGYGPF